MTAAFAADAGDAGRPTFRDVVAGELRAHLARRRISNRRLAAMLDTTPAWIDRRLNGTTPTDVDDLEAICAVLEISPAELLAGITFHPNKRPLTSRPGSRSGRRRDLNTEVDTCRYSAALSRPTRHLALVSDATSGYRSITAGYGTSALESADAERRYIDLDSAGADNAHTA